MNELYRQQQKKEYKLGDFEGPLDLLLYLVRKHRINLYDIPIADLTRQYLAYTNDNMEELDNMADFYNMASQLLYIKSQLLLPSDMPFDDDEDPRSTLVAQLIEYAKFKHLASLLEVKQLDDRWQFIRRNDEVFLPFPAQEEADDTTLLDLNYCFYRLIEEKGTPAVFSFFEQFTVNEKLTLLRELLDKTGEVYFSNLILHHNNYEIICAFLAMLESSRIGFAKLHQAEMYDDILIQQKANKNELEFY